MSGRSAAWQRACLGRGPTDSNSSIPYFGFSVFSVIWGICFSVAVGTPVDPAPPARIRTCRIAACGSYRGCLAWKRKLG